MESKKDQLICRSRNAFTRLARFINQLMREQLAGSPVTVQQCYTLEALMEQSRTMSELAGEVAIHQSTLSRIVEKLEKQGFVKRTRPAENQRKVEVNITEKGRQMYQYLDSQCNQMISGLIDLIPAQEQEALLTSLEAVTRLLDPQNEDFQKILKQCCCSSADNIIIIDEKPQ